MEESRRRKYAELSSKVGKTPLHVITPHTYSFEQESPHRIFAKAEFENPTESHYDRVYVPLIRTLEEEGRITPGETPLIETTSGNAGASFAWVCREMGYDATVIIPDNLPEGRIRDITQYGPTIRTTPGEDYVRGAADELKRVLTIENKERKAQGLPKFWSPNHSQDMRSAQLLEPIAKEILDETQGTLIDYLILAAGNGASILGPARVFRERSPQTKIIAWEPLASGAAFDMIYSGRYQELYRIEPGTLEHNMYGTGVANVDFPMLKEAIRGNDHPPVVDRVELAADRNTLNQLYKQLGIYRKVHFAEVEEACLLANPTRALSRRSARVLDQKNKFESNFFFWEDQTKRLRKKGFDVGRSSVASYALADEIARRHKEPQNIAVIFYDPAHKYAKESPWQKLRKRFAA